jgi:glycosyltransferase involved in cell wall biosynthesis
VAQSFDHAILITDNEKQLFAATVYDTEKLTVIGNGVDLDYFNPLGQPQEVDTLEEKTPELLFVGAMDYHANVDGVCWFAEDVWPAIVERYPTAVFTIVGRNPAKEVLALQRHRNIRVTGGVDDVRPYYRRATIVVVPLRIARGIQNKVLEAMAMGKPTIVSVVAFTGIGAESGRDLLVADSSNDFIKYIDQLTCDVSFREKLETESQLFVKMNFSWTDKMKSFFNLINSNVT